MGISVNYTNMQMLSDGLEKTNNILPANNAGEQQPFFKPAIQRKEDDAVQQQQAPQGWSSKMLSILVYDDSYQGNCFGMSDESGNAPLSSCMKWPSCRTFSIPLRVEYYIDRANGAHPQPIKVWVSIKITFTPNGGQEKILYKSTDTNPAYSGPNMILSPSFGKKFPVSIDEDGKLSVMATLHDDAGSQDIIYSDNKSFVVLCS